MTGNPPEWEPPSHHRNIQWYTLKYRKPVLLNNKKHLPRLFDSYKKHVRSTYIGDYWVSTVFLFLDHSLALNSEPVLFETMVFKEGFESLDCFRATTWREALNNHWESVRGVKDGRYEGN